MAIAPFTGICDALIGGAVGRGSTASVVTGAVAMIVVPIKFGVVRCVRRQREGIR